MLTVLYSSKRLLMLVLATVGIILLSLLQHWIDTTLLFFLVCLFSVGVIFSFFETTLFFSILILILPFSINVVIPHTESNILFPSELLVGILAVVTIIKLAFFKSFDTLFLKHPLTIFVLFYLLMQTICACFSNMYTVSIKFLLIRYFYILVFYFLTNLFVRCSSQNGIRLYWLYSLSLLPISVYALYKHSLLDFQKTGSTFVSEPFYNDHTIFSACLVFVLPSIIAAIMLRSKLNLGLMTSLSFVLILIILSVAIFFSYSRAAWISVLASILFFVLVQLKIRWYFLLMLILAGIIWCTFNSDLIVASFSQNTFDSNVHDADVEHLAKSVTNVNNDISNAERLNRWSCAIRMTEQKPIVGFGPGTYQFNYLNFQLPSELTRISVNSAYDVEKGQGGTAHSEYLLLLAESGIITFISFLLLIIGTIYLGIKKFYAEQNKQTKIILMVTLIGFVSYTTHAFFNNFLDTDKAAFLFWGSVSIVATIDSRKHV